MRAEPKSVTHGPQRIVCLFQEQPELAHARVRPFEQDAIVGLRRGLDGRHVGRRYHRGAQETTSSANTNRTAPAIAVTISASVQVTRQTTMARPVLL